jgi:hypothetical protein
LTVPEGAQSELASRAGQPPIMGGWKDQSMGLVEAMLDGLVRSQRVALVLQRTSPGAS